MLDQNEQAQRLPWDGCENARDVGGCPIAQGGMIRRHVLIRSDSLHQLPPEGLAVVYDYGVRTVIDLRLANELEKRPSPFAASQQSGLLPRYLNLPMHDMATEALLDAAVPTSTIGVYMILLEQSKAFIGAIIKAVAERLKYGGVLVNCHAGKDRTGIIVALLLSIAGAERDAIAQDYALSEVMLEPGYQEWVQQQVKLHGAPPPDKPWQAQTRPETMYALLDYLDRQYGGAEGYLYAAGVTQNEIEQIRKHLIACA
ncbi:MAG: tyrosine-protein phosphatase [Chloroflexia bacterium]